LMTTMSRPASCCEWCRNDSRIILLMRFRAVALRQCFFEMARPSLAISSLLSRQSTVNNLSRLRVAFLNTRPKAAALSSRFVFWNRYALLLLVRLGLCFVVVTAVFCYGVSCARPFARRRFSTRRPAFVAIRARKPWVRARLILLGWNVRFMTYTWIINRRVWSGFSEGRQGYSDAQTVSIDGCKPWNFSIDCPVFLLSYTCGLTRWYFGSFGEFLVC
jgi:hypothetical protein